MKRFPWLFTLLWLLILVVMLSAGFWQLNRAEEKRLMAKRMSAGQTAVPTSAKDWAQLQAFDQVMITGHFQPQQFLLSNQIVDGQVGFFVFTAFTTVNQLHLLVNRGWVATADAEIQVTDHEVQLTGLVADWPRPGIQLGEQILTEQQQQVVTYWPPDLTRQWLQDQLCQPAACEVLSQVMKLSPEAPLGFVRKWQAPVMTPAKHQAYAVQWFSMSAVLLLVWLIFIRKHYAGKD